MANLAPQSPKRRKRPFLVDLYSSTLGKKYAMAVTGVMLIGFVVAHMIGNLKVYLGAMDPGSKFAYHIDEYGHFLRTMGTPIVPESVILWGMRIGLFAALVIHVHAAISLSIVNRKARTVKYQSKREFVAANYAGRTMRISGMLITLFILFHLADLTWGASPVATGKFEEGMVYTNLVASFNRPLVSIIYIVANLVLGTHLYHGVWSLFQSLGVFSPKFNKWRRGLAIGVAVAVVAGNISMPLAVLTNVIK